MGKMIPPVPYADPETYQFNDFFLGPEGFPFKNESFADDSGHGNGRSEFFQASIFYSLLIHLLVLLSLIVGVYRPDRRPIKEVDYWVVNLVPDINAEPRGLKKVPPKDILSKVKAPLPLSSPAAEIQAPRKMEVPSEVEDQVAASFQGMTDSLENHVQSEQYIFRMKMNDPMLGMKIIYFQKSTHAYFQGLLHSSLSQEILRTLHGKWASANLSYLEDGRIQEVSFSPDSDLDLAQILKEKIPWHSLSAPRKFSLPHRTIKVSLAINDQGNFQVWVEVL